MAVHLASRETDPLKTALVTGATGFTGGHLAQSLHRDGVQVRALARPTSNRQELESAGIGIADGDVTNADSLAQAVHGVDVVFHIAAAYRDAALDESAMRAVNATGTRLVLEAADRAGVKRVVHCSTIGVHGHIQDPPGSEETALAPGDAYQRTKLEGEKIAQSFQPQSAMEIAIFRPCAIYGPGDLRFAKLFRAIARRRFVMVGSGQVLYHLVYIDDLVRGIRLCGTHPRAPGETFILGGRGWTTLSTMVQTIAEVLGAPPPRWRVPFAPVYAAAALCESVSSLLGVEPPLYRRRVDFFRKSRAFDIAKAGSILGYEPQVSMRDGLARTAAWYQEADLL